MRLLHLVYWSFLYVVMIAAQTIDLNAQNTKPVEKNLKIRIDFQSARAVVDLLEQNRVTDADLNRVAKLFGNQQLIRKVGSNKSAITAETFKQTLRRTIENQSLAAVDPFEWQTVKKNLPEICLLINQIEKNQDALFADLENMIQPYVPGDLKADATAVFLVGGYSLGFAFGDGNFYVALHKAGGDYEGLKYIVAHELYHSIQSLGREKRIAGLKEVKVPDNVRNNLILIESAYFEGTAHLVGNPLDAKNLKQLGQSQLDEYKKNLTRSRHNFALFEALLFQAYNDPHADARRLYNIGFTTTFDQTLYYVGYQMARVIEKYQGKQAIAALALKNPLELFDLYVKLYKKNNDPTLLKFSPTTEDILSKLQQWEGQNALIYEGW